MRKGKRGGLVSRLGLMAALTAVLALVAASAAPAVSIPPSPLKGIEKLVAGKTLKQREAILLRLAKQEGGQLNWYTSLSKTIYPSVAAAFEKKYPGIKVNVYRGHSEDVSARLYQEAAAGTSGADVVETNGTEMLFYQHKKTILVQYQGKIGSPYANAIPKAFKSCCYTADRVEGFVLAYNTNLVSPSELPKTWADLANPKWKGKFEMEPTDADWFAAAYTAMEQAAYRHLQPKPRTKAAKAAALKRIDASLDKTWQGIAANARMVSGHTTEATLLAAGEYDLCVSCHAQSVENLADEKHAPVAFQPVHAPVVLRPQGIGIVYRLQHPAAAMLFYDWMLRPNGGQSVLRAGGASPAIPSMGDPKISKASHINMNLYKVVHNYAFWAKKYDSIVRLGSGG